MKALVTGFDPFGGDEVNPVLARGRQAEEADRRHRRSHCRAADVLCEVGRRAAGGDRQGPARHRALRRPGRRPQRALPGARRHQRPGRPHPRQRRQAADRQAGREGRPGRLFRHPADQGLRGSDAQGGVAGGGVEHGRHLRLQPHPLFADGHRPGPSRGLPRRLPAHPLRARAGRPRRRRAVDGAGRHRARHRDHPGGECATSTSTVGGSGQIHPTVEGASSSSEVRPACR